MQITALPNSHRECMVNTQQSVLLELRTVLCQITALLKQQKIMTYSRGVADKTPVRDPKMAELCVGVLDSTLSNGSFQFHPASPKPYCCMHQPAWVLVLCILQRISHVARFWFRRRRGCSYSHFKCLALQGRWMKIFLQPSNVQIMIPEMFSLTK